MSLLRIVHYPDPILLTVAKPVAPDEFDGKLAELVDDMFATMADKGGVGLAAPQVAISKRLFVMDIPGTNGDVHVTVSDEACSRKPNNRSGSHPPGGQGLSPTLE